jgi:hypothetical protein
LTVHAVNSKEHWDSRFASGDWLAKGGRAQTRAFAEAQVRLLPLSRDFNGTLLDFGCGLGDAMPVYRRVWPLARLVGVDFSPASISQCRSDYGHVADFICGSHLDVPSADVIIASNVVEHLSNDLVVVATLRERCNDLFVVVPYRERLVPGGEHVNAYDRTSFRELGPCHSKVFLSQGWSQYGRDLWVNVYLKNLVRPLLGRPLGRRHRQIAFHFRRVTRPPGCEHS